MLAVKRVFTVLLVTTALALASLSAQAEDGETLIVNYYRFDDDFSFFDSVWLWPEEPDSMEGERYEWTDEDTDFGAQLELDLTDTNLEDATEAGIIVRGDDWEQRDVNQDLFIDMTQMEDGELEVWLVQGDPTVYYEEAEADTSHRFLHARFEDRRTISYNATAPTEEEDIEVLENGDEVAIEVFDIDHHEGEITLEEEIDLQNEYTLRGDLGEEEPAERRIEFGGIYDTEAFEEAYGYDGELGAVYDEDETEFKLWAPIAEGVELNLYAYGHTSNEVDYDGNEGVDDPYETIEMDEGEQGVWSTTVEGDQHGTYYTFTVDNGDAHGEHEVTDPYSESTGVNGQRSMVVDFDRLKPDGWEAGRGPDNIDSHTDAIIYELHVRDLTSHESWDGTEEYRGKFLGLTEEGTEHEGVSTGFDHIQELGVPHVHLLPVMDFGMVDETRLDDEDYHGIYDGIFNWGYMPRHFNALEGSYSTDPFDGSVQVEEFKQMVQDFHEAEIGVIMDVVYNHTGQSAESNFHRILPGYYHRLEADGSFSDGSGTGNETASERKMMRNFMVDSLTFYAEQYNIDGFRFDLMALHDIETMNIIAEELQEIDEDIVIYGEPWTGGESLLPDDQMADKDALDQMDDIAVFNDDTRDGTVQGSAFDNYGTGFVQGDSDDPAVMLGITGATEVPGLPYEAWAESPSQSVNYISAHDNNTVRDKLVLSTVVDPLDEEVDGAGEEITREEVQDMLDEGDTWHEIERMQRQANNIVLASQGMTFMHAGVEMMRTKPCLDPDVQEDYCDPDGLYDANSYRSPDETNQLDWNWKADYNETYEYVRNLVHLNREKDFFSYSTAEELQGNIALTSQEDGLIAYALYDDDDLWRTTLVVHNNGAASRDFDMPGGQWNVVATTEEAGELIGGEEMLETLYKQDGGETIELDPNDSLIMYNEEEIDIFADPDRYADQIEEDGLPTWGIVLITIGGITVVGGVGIALYASGALKRG